ncbi:MAG: GGDEF domain-containing protein [Treponema sp.]|nr:GGDEF domain-containing protein [Treponema sp.]
MKKHSLNPSHAKFISTSLVGLVFAAILIILTDRGFRKTLQKAEKQYYDSLYSTLDGFSQTAEQLMINYSDSLAVFYVPEIIEHVDSQDIHNFLCRYDSKKNPDFLAMYYIDMEGTGYFSNGNTMPMKLENHPILSENIDFAVSAVLYAERSEKYVTSFERAVYDENGNKKGALGASIYIDSIIKRLDLIKAGDNIDTIVLDQKGQFIYSKNTELIGSVFTSENNSDKPFTSLDIIECNEPMLANVDLNGEKVDILIKKIPAFSRTFAISVPHAAIEAIYTEQKNTKLIAILSSMIIIIVLVLIETRIMEFFQKRQFFSASYDSLTNLWTRQHFEEEATKLLKANPKVKFMLIEADIRGFKFINETYGEESADKLIVFYSGVLNHFATMFHGIIGRGFADRFYILLKVTSVHKAMNEFKTNMVVCQQMTDSSDIPFFPKFGIAFLLPDNKKRDITIQGLIGQASFAKSTIKDDALTSYSVYNARLLDKINEEHFIETHMQQALDAGEFFVMYQPKISLKDEKICGAEALVRWNSPEQGFMTPDKFIPLFERNGFIKKLDFFVYEEVFKLLQSQIKNGEDVVPISVNMSRNHNKPEKFIHDFLELFNKYDVPPKYVQLEIIERSFMDNNTLSEITTKLHDEGFSVAMDDFGSGESSLNMLTSIPVDVLKFDRVFLLSSMNEDGTMNKKSAEFIHILINLSKNLEKISVFEGVETKEQCDFLKSIDCDVIQGYFYSRPLSEKDYLEFLKMHI